jgi:hypothetical protein
MIYRPKRSKRRARIGQTARKIGNAVQAQGHIPQPRKAQRRGTIEQEIRAHISRLSGWQTNAAAAASILGKPSAWTRKGKKTWGSLDAHGMAKTVRACMTPDNTNERTDRTDDRTTQTNKNKNTHARKTWVTGHNITERARQAKRWIAAHVPLAARRAMERTSEYLDQRKARNQRNTRRANAAKLSTISTRQAPGPEPRITPTRSRAASRKKTRRPKSRRRKGRDSKKQHSGTREARVQIIIRASGHERTITVPASATGQQLRQACANNLRIPAQLIRISFEGHEIDPLEPAWRSGIDQGAVIDVHLGCAGGAHIRNRKYEPGGWRFADGALRGANGREVVLTEEAKTRITSHVNTEHKIWPPPEIMSEMVTVPTATIQDSMAEALATVLLGCPSGAEEIRRVWLLANEHATNNQASAATAQEAEWGQEHAKLVAIAMGASLDIIKPDGRAWRAYHGTQGQNRTHYMTENANGSYSATVTADDRALMDRIETDNRAEIWEWASKQTDSEGEPLGQLSVRELVQREMNIARKAATEKEARRARIKPEWAEPIVVNSIRKTSMCRLGAWNVFRKFQPRAIASFMLDNGIEHLAVSEHGLDSSNSKSKNWANAELIKYGFRTIWSPAQVIIYNEQQWHGRLTAGKQWNKCKGRVMAQLYQTATAGQNGQAAEHLGIISVYGVSGSGDNDPLEGRTRGAVRRDLTETTRNIIEEMEQTCPGIKIVMAGDYNDCLSTSNLESTEEATRGPHHEGLAEMALSMGWASAVRSKHPSQLIVSHYTHKGARLIDHAMLNASAQKSLRDATIGTHGSDEYIASDHDP